MFIVKLGTNIDQNLEPLHHLDHLVIGICKGDQRT